MSTDVIQGLNDSYKEYTDYSGDGGPEQLAQKELNDNNDLWVKSKGKNPDMLMMVWLMKIMQDGSVYDNKLAGKGYGNADGGSIISCAQNKLTDVAKQMNVLTAFRGVDSDMEAAYNDNNPADDASNMSKMRSDLAAMDKYVSGTGSPGDNTIFDQGTKDAIHGSITQISASLDQVDKYYGGSLSQFQAAVSDKDSPPNDDGSTASGIAQSIGQNFSTVTQGCSTVNQTLQTTMEYDKNNITQYTSLLQQLLKIMNMVPGLSVQNQGK